MPGTNDSVVRAAVSRVVAAHFLRHLQEEQGKPDAMLFEEERDLSARQVSEVARQGWTRALVQAGSPDGMPRRPELMALWL